MSDIIFEEVPKIKEGYTVPCMRSNNNGLEYKSSIGWLASMAKILESRYVFASKMKDLGIGKA